MGLPQVYPGEQLVLKERLTAGHPYARIQYQTSHRLDVPAGTQAKVVGLNGTESRVRLIPHAGKHDADSVDIMVAMHMMPVLFNAPEGGSKSEQASQG